MTSRLDKRGVDTPVRPDRKREDGSVFIPDNVLLLGQILFTSCFISFIFERATLRTFDFVTNMQTEKLQMLC